MAAPKTALEAAEAIARWLAKHPESQPNVRVSRGIDREHPGSIVVHDPEGCQTYIGYEALAGVAYEGGPYYWPVEAVPNAVFRGELDLGPFWVEAANGWAALVYRE